ncbi:MAG: winged helix-turn-helix domain-containing protein [Planctomycetes bacterium]|nr:winged helix-turn-helix domain-containing protein [Planctomycetota bacterium]
MGVDAVEDHHVSCEVHPRLLIKAIQENLGITKKEISERTGISYGTLNRYTRCTMPTGRPRRSSIERLRNLYEASLHRPSRPTGSGRPGAEYDQRLLLKAAPDFDDLDRDSWSLGRQVDALDFRGLRKEPFVQFLRRLTFYAHEDLQQFAASGYRDRQCILQSRELVGDMYVALLNGLGDASFASRCARATEPAHPGV